MEGTVADQRSRMPAEWEPHERTIVCWPARDAIWRGLRDRAVEDTVAVVAAVSRFEPVTVVAQPGRAPEAEDRLARDGVTAEVVALPIDDSWARDSGPVYVDDGGTRTVVDFRFNAWGDKYHPHGDDALLAGRWAERRGEPLVHEDLVLEGGAVTVDGAGTLATTQQCLLHTNRNPHLHRAAIEEVLARRLGVDVVVWLPHGLALDEDTDGHVDNVAAFVAPGHLLLQGCDDPGEEDHDRLQLNERWANCSPDARGAPIRVDVLEVLPFVELAGERRPVPYLNLYVCNGGVVVPVTGHPADDDSLARIGDCFPGREVVGVPGEVLALGGGGPHCITQQVPAVSPPPTTGDRA